MSTTIPSVTVNVKVRHLDREKVAIAQAETTFIRRVSNAIAARPATVDAAWARPHVMRVLAAADALGLGFVKVRWLEDVGFGGGAVRLSVTGRDADGAEQVVELKVPPGPERALPRRGESPVPWADGWDATASDVVPGGRCEFCERGFEPNETFYVQRRGLARFSAHSDCLRENAPAKGGG